MLKSVLLYLENAELSQPVIQLGVALASEVDARVRGLTLLDTREFDASRHLESAVYLSQAVSRSASTECAHQDARTELSKACLAARLNFDVRRISGDPLELLPAEARFHDLLIAASGHPHQSTTTQLRLSPGDMLALLRRGVQPLLVLPPKIKDIQRILLVYDGTEAAGRVIRSYLHLGIFRDGEYRLLAIGKDEAAARALLAEMGEYCASHCKSLETGCATGKSRRVLIPYAEKWNADLLVLGISRSYRWMQRLFRQPSLDLARVLNCSLFVQA